VYYWFRRLMRRMLFKTIHDLALLLDRLLAERAMQPTAGVIDSQSVKAPAASKRGYDANKKIKERKRHGRYRWTAAGSEPDTGGYGRFDGREHDARCAERTMAVGETPVWRCRL
jgi:hypothetical protein